MASGFGGHVPVPPEKRTVLHVDHGYGGNYLIKMIAVFQIAVGLLICWIAWQLLTDTEPQPDVSRQVAEVCWVEDVNHERGIRARVVCGETAPEGYETFLPDQADHIQSILDEDQ